MRGNATRGSALVSAMMLTAATTDTPPTVEARIGPITKTSSFAVAATPSARGNLVEATMSFRSARSTPKIAPLTSPARPAATTRTGTGASAAIARTRPTNASVRNPVSTRA